LDWVQWPALGHCAEQARPNTRSLDDLAELFSRPAVELVIRSELDSAPLVIARVVEPKHGEDWRVVNGTQINESIGREVDAEHVRETVIGEPTPTMIGRSTVECDATLRKSCRFALNSEEVVAT
jgi:hypothetical protein